MKVSATWRPISEEPVAYKGSTFLFCREKPNPSCAYKIGLWEERNEFFTHYIPLIEILEPLVAPEKQASNLAERVANLERLLNV